MYVCFFFFLLMVWNYYFISARWLPPLRINKVKVKVLTALKDHGLIKRLYLGIGNSLNLRVTAPALRLRL